VLLGYVLVSAVCSTLACALFEVTTTFQRHNPMNLDASIKAEIGADKLIQRGYIVLAVFSLLHHALPHTSICRACYTLGSSPCDAESSRAA
jgi:hypothetical protein